MFLQQLVVDCPEKKTMPVQNVSSRGEEVVEQEVQGPGIMELHEELRAEVIKGMPLKDAFVLQKQLDAQKNKQASQADDFDFLEYESPIRPQAPQTAVERTRAGRPVGSSAKKRRTEVRLLMEQARAIEEFPDEIREDQVSDGDMGELCDDDCCSEDDEMLFYQSGDEGGA